MNLDEAKAAFYHRIPVWYDGTEYPYIQALRYQQHSPYPIVQLELLDKNRILGVSKSDLIDEELEEMLKETLPQ